MKATEVKMGKPMMCYCKLYLITKQQCSQYRNEETKAGLIQRKEKNLNSKSNMNKQCDVYIVVSQIVCVSVFMQECL